MTKSFLLFVIYALCVTRLTRLIVADAITEKFRKWIERHATMKLRNAHSTWIEVDPEKAWLWRKFYTLTSCSWCVSFWVALPIVGVAYYNGTWFQYLCVPFALSAVAGLISDSRGT